MYKQFFLTQSAYGKSGDALAAEKLMLPAL